MTINYNRLIEFRDGEDWKEDKRRNQGVIKKDVLGNTLLVQTFILCCELILGGNILIMFF